MGNGFIWAAFYVGLVTGIISTTVIFMGAL